MQITELHPPVNGGTLYFGKAVSTRGRHYRFNSTFDGEVCCIFRETEDARWWKQISAPKALTATVQTAMRQAQA